MPEITQNSEDLRSYSQLHRVVEDRHRSGQHLNASEPNTFVGDDFVSETICVDDQEGLFYSIVPESAGWHIVCKPTEGAELTAWVLPNVTVPADSFHFFANKESLWLFFDQDIVELPPETAAELRVSIAKSRVVEDLQSLYNPKHLGKTVLAHLGAEVVKDHPELRVIADVPAEGLEIIKHLGIEHSLPKRTIGQRLKDQLEIAVVYDDLLGDVFGDNFVGIKPVDDEAWEEYFISGQKAFIYLSDHDPIAPREAYVEFEVDDDGHPVEGGTIVCHIDDKRVGCWTTEEGASWEAAHLDAFIWGDTVEAYQEDGQLGHLDQKNTDWVKTLLGGLEPIPLGWR